MRIEINVEKKYFFGLMLIGLIVIGVVGVYAYNSAGTGGNPVNFGHSVDEMDWSKAISRNVTAAGFCINNSGTMDCRTAWPYGGGVKQIVAGDGIIISPTGG